MRLLITGATGFLGKELLRQALLEPTISRIGAITRRPITHPDPRVQVICCDLSSPGSLDEMPRDWDQVVHLQGLYDLNAPYALCYLQNVMATAQLVDWLQRLNPGMQRLHFASTYAIGVGLPSGEPLREAPLRQRPDAQHAYALSKALAEECLWASRFSVHSYRFGIIIGRSTDGMLEKTDGPYYFIKTLGQLSRLGVLRRLPVLPVPAAAKATMPLVPVDIAAQVLLKAVLQAARLPAHNACYGVFNASSVSVQEFVQATLRHFQSAAVPLFWKQENAAGWQEKITGIPEEVFAFVQQPQTLENEHFKQCFPDVLVPDFKVYQSALYRGLESFLGWDQ